MVCWLQIFIPRTNIQAEVCVDPFLQTDVPTSPECIDWASHFPAFLGPEASLTSSHGGEKPMVRFADIGCGFGGLLIR